MNDEVEITIIATGFQSDSAVLEDKNLDKVKQNVEAVNNFANRRYEGFPIGRNLAGNQSSVQPQQHVQSQYQQPQQAPRFKYEQPKADFVKNDGVQTSRLQVDEPDDIPPYLKKLREHR